MFEFMYHPVIGFMVGVIFITVMMELIRQEAKKHDNNPTARK